jgi:biopolymer transport protein ExbD/biopolymer transport protein TolR
MAFASLGGKRGILSDVNVVPLIDILLVLLVIFMIIPHHQMGLQADLPQQSTGPDSVAGSEAIIVQHSSDGSLRINQSVIEREALPVRRQQVFALRAQHVAFLKGDRLLEFHAVAQVLDLMHSAGASSVGWLTSELEKNR